MLRPWFVLALVALLALGLVFGVVACGTEPEASSTTSSGGTGTTWLAGSIPHLTGAADVVLRLSDGGGMPLPGWDLIRLPQFTLFGDGRIIVVNGAPSRATLPDRPLPELQTMVVSEEVIQAILAAAKEATLFQNGGDYEYGEPAMTDQDTTTITINAGGATYTTDIYALGFDPDEEVSVTREQQQARDIVDAFRARLNDPDSFGGQPLAWEPYDVPALKVFSQPAPADIDIMYTDVHPNHLTWPLADLGTSGNAIDNRGLRARVITGRDLATLKAALPQATQWTVWQSGAAGYLLDLRPILPDEAAMIGTETTASVTAPGGTTSTYETRNGRISGRVTDSNGVGLPNVMIDVVALAPQWGSIAGESTDASGFYAVYGLPTEQFYVVTMNRDGYVDEWYDDIPAADNYDGTGAARIDLSATRIRSNVDFLLERGRTISGRVTDSSGKGIYGLSVAAVTEDVSAGVALGDTGEDGTYTLVGVPPGRYLVSVENGDGFIDEWYKDLIYAGNPNGAGATPVDVTDANATGIDFTLEVGRSISGRVYIGTTPAKEGLVVACTPSGESVQAVNIDPDTGEYRLIGLPAGSYKIRTIETGAVDAWCGGDAVSVDGSGDYAPTIVVGSENVMGKDFVLAKVGT